MRTDMLKLVKRGKPYSVFRNTETGQYELWLMAGREFVEQEDIFDRRSEAFEALPWADDAFERWFDED